MNLFLQIVLLLAFFLMFVVCHNVFVDIWNRVDLFYKKIVYYFWSLRINLRLMYFRFLLMRQGCNKKERDIQVRLLLEEVDRILVELKR